VNKIAVFEGIGCAWENQSVTNQ